MSACHDCPRYSNPSYTGPRQQNCCMEKMREPDMQAQREALEDMLRRDQLVAEQNHNNRHARRRAAKLAR